MQRRSAISPFVQLLLSGKWGRAAPARKRAPKLEAVIIAESDRPIATLTRTQPLQ